MTKRRNSPQKKEQKEMTAKDLITDTNKMSESEFRIVIIRILAGVENSLESLSSGIKEVKASG